MYNFYGLGGLLNYNQSLINWNYGEFSHGLGSNINSLLGYNQDYINSITGFGSWGFGNSASGVGAYNEAAIASLYSFGAGYGYNPNYFGTLNSYM